MKTEHPLPKLSAPAQRALAGAGITSVEKLSEFSEAQIMKLHGIGKTAIPILKAAMAGYGLHFAHRE